MFLQRTLFYIITFIGILGTLAKIQAIVFASSQPVEATIKISICGNEVKEGGEDCDNLDLNNQTCNSLGFGGGQLSCDIACSFDTVECLPPTPTPTPAPTAISTPTLSSSNNTSSSSDDSEEQDTQPSLFQLTDNGLTSFFSDISQLLTAKPTQSDLVEQPYYDRFFQTALPYDENRNLVLETFELPNLLEDWVRQRNAFILIIASKQAPQPATPEYAALLTCDVNGDEVCDLVDFSIILYYTEAKLGE